MKSRSATSGRGSSSSRWSQVSATPSGTRSAVRCSPRFPVRLSPASGPGVQEDVPDVILNLRALVVSSEQDEPVVMYLRKQGPGEVTAADIAPPAGVEVHNPGMHIATLNSKGKLEMELTVERGRGYVSAAQNKQPGQEIGRVPIDSIYSPVMRVAYKVEATRVEQRTDFDRLILDV